MTPSCEDVLFVGALTLDSLYRVDDFSRGPGKYIAREKLDTASGMASNAATAAARLGGRPALWASVGDDAAAPALIGEIVAEGVDCRHVRRVSGGRSATATIVVDATGERWVLVDYDPRTQAVPSADELPPVHFYAAVMADVRWPGAAKMALEAARHVGRPAILDADVAPEDVLTLLAASATHIVASAPAAEILTGETSPGAAARRLCARHGCFACVTDGGAGAFWTGPDTGEIRHVVPPRVEVVDTNGAGDVFHGAFAQALAEGRSPETALRFASAAAALKCTVVGGRLGAPNRQRTLELMKASYGE
ncbi:PfkB family carbohydrate kinase [Tropicimonas sp. IMCC6043]|uniref:PfkB family carbohydrate kinase n=1 Tax=Tropicimonas sp. IMCC6043 TaxID=2510645 RepID=UPI00101E0AF9|nr:PfkB family carbohydrate kinase [Tropicimonas sp. IMCC6043]RYH12070.1 sugar kinase [Tropicimonas sp. IMCC6043]